MGIAESVAGGTLVAGLGALATLAYRDRANFERISLWVLKAGAWVVGNIVLVCFVIMGTMGAAFTGALEANPEAPLGRFADSIAAIQLWWGVGWRSAVFYIMLALGIGGLYTVPEQQSASDNSAAAKAESGGGPGPPR